MDDLAIGRTVRAARVQRRWRQSDTAAACEVSRQTVSRLELGDLEGMPLGTIRAICAALGIRVVLELRGAGAEIDRLRGAHHSAMHEEVARQFSRLPEWIDEAEVTFAIYGERGAIDVVAWHAPTRSLLVIELKTELVDLQETVGTLDRKTRLAAEIARTRAWVPDSVSTWLLVADSPTNRRRAAAHEAMLRSRYPADGHAMAAWLRRPAGRIAAMSFLSSAHPTGTGRRLAPVRRVRRPRTGVAAGSR